MNFIEEKEANRNRKIIFNNYKDLILEKFINF